jgi:endonuclease/exonuclease/phosphatase (EEP) superfamily protein YafD
LLGRLWWGFELFANFRPQLAAASLVALVLAALARERAAVIASLALLLVNGAPLGPYLGGARAAPNGPSTTLSVLTLNLHGGGTDAAALQSLLRREDPDIVLLTEMPRDMGRLLGAIDARYPYKLRTGHGRGGELLLLSRWQPKSWHVDLSATRWQPILVADLCARAERSGACVRIVGLHAQRPFGKYARAWRNAALARAGALAAGAGDRPAVLMGDFNLTPWAPSFATLLEETGLKDTSRLRGLSATWISRNPLFGLFIDHILVSADVEALESKVGPFVGSDHRPVIARLGLRSPRL